MNKKWSSSETRPAPRHAVPLVLRWVVRRVMLVLVMGLPIWAHGHDVAPAIPEQPGWRAGAAVAVAALHADEPTPEAQPRGVLGLGHAWRDRRGLRLEHASLDAGLRLHRHLGAWVALGLHDHEKPHVETAWLESEHAFGAAHERWALGWGRRNIPLGAVLSGAGHFDRFALRPLAQRAVFEGDWQGDGLLLSWRRPEGQLLRGAELGVWRARSFPGAVRGPWAPTWHVALARDEWALDVFAAALQPEGRGAAAQGSEAAGSEAAHSHSAPDCTASLNGVVCFDGRVSLWGASWRWAPEGGPLSVSAAGLLRRERGALYSASGDTRYQGRTAGGWLEAQWRITPEWLGALRAERVQATHSLSGAGAGTVAQEAALLPNQGGQRVAASLAYELAPGWQINTEFGRERHSSGHVPYGLVRLLWQAPQWQQGGW
jgi:hypothetical protein